MSMTGRKKRAPPVGSGGRSITPGRSALTIVAGAGGLNCTEIVVGGLNCRRDSRPKTAAKP